MSTVDDIEQAIRKLGPHDLAALRQMRRKGARPVLGGAGAGTPLPDRRRSGVGWLTSMEE
jgi:hypothetical protein